MSTTRETAAIPKKAGQIAVGFVFSGVSDEFIFQVLELRGLDGSNFTARGTPVK